MLTAEKACDLKNKLFKAHNDLVDALDQMVVGATDPALQGAANANAVIASCQTFLAMRPVLQEISTQNTNVPFGTEWLLMNSVTMNSDGTPGTADGSPSNASGHAINATTYNINGYYNETQLSNLLSACVSYFLPVIDGSSVSANGAMAAWLATVESNSP
jgi:hypothetical protein